MSMIRLASDDDEREHDDDSLDGGVVAVAEVVEQCRPDPGPVERRLGEHGSRQEQRDREADDRDHRNERVPKRVVVHDRVLVDPAGTGCLDVVVLHRADDVDAHEADEHAGRDETERDRGQDQVLDDVDERVPVPRDERVDEVEVRVGLQRRVDERARAAGRRQPAEVRTEEELRHQPEEEHGHRVDDDSEQAAPAVDPGVAKPTCEQPECDTDDDRDDHREERQLERRRAVHEDDVADRTAVRRRNAEVALDDVPEIVGVLDQDRSVVPELPTYPLELRLRHTSPESRRDRISRCDAHQQEDEREQDEDHRDDEQEPRQHVLPERCPFCRHRRLHERITGAEQGEGRRVRGAPRPAVTTSRSSNTA